jgi:radical SAM modification target selenobiotic family peptide
MEGKMDKNHLKQLLAGLCISSLVSGAALLTGCDQKSPSGGSGSKSDAGTTQSG